MGREEGGGFRMGNTCIPVADSLEAEGYSLQTGDKERLSCPGFLRVLPGFNNRHHEWNSSQCFEIQGFVVCVN